MDWNEEAIARLRMLWDEGHSTAEIGRRMSVSKNAVVGKAHRLNLPARPSPIRRDVSGGVARPPAPKRVTGPTLPPLAAHAVVPAAPPVHVPSPSEVIASSAVAVPSRPAAPIINRSAVLRPVPQSRMRTASCCWPIGEPGTKSFRFCDSDATPNKPYCGEHAQLAYVKVRDRRDEAAA